MIKAIIIFFILFFLFNVLLIIIDTRARKKTTKLPMPLWRNWYTWRRPFHKLETIWGNLRAAIHRGFYGWAYRDVWDMDSYIIDVLSQMLRYLAANHEGFPMWCGEQTNSDEEASALWEETLINMASLLEKLDQDYSVGPANIFNEQYEKIVFKPEEEYTEEDKDLVKAFCTEANRIGLKQKEWAKEVFALLGEYFYDLWD